MPPAICFQSIWGRWGMSDYELRKLADLLLVPISGTRPAGGVSNETEGMPSLGGENIVQEGGMTYREVKKIPEKFFNQIGKCHLKPGDVLINKDGAQTGKVGIYGGEFPRAAINEHLFILRAKNVSELSQRYLYYSLLLPKTQLKIHSRITGSAQPGLNSSFVDAVDIPFRKLSTQKVMVSYLQLLDDLITKTEALTTKLTKVKNGLMHDLFTRGVTADSELRPPRDKAPDLYKETPIGWIPKEWEVSELGLRISVIDPNPSHRYPDEVEDGIPICSTENFRGDDDFDLTKSKCVSQITFEEQSVRCNFSPTDVIFARKGKIGLARRYAEGSKVFSHTVVVIKPLDATVDEDWLLWLARSQWVMDGIRTSMNTNLGVPTLGVSFINKLQLPFPQTNEQEIIAKQLDAVARKITQEIAELIKLRRLKSGLMHDLLTGKKPVDDIVLDPPEPSHV